ncbi:MAG: rhodanese-like domain-containing protein [Alphaproteobacteria bacterium]
MLKIFSGIPAPIAFVLFIVVFFSLQSMVVRAQDGDDSIGPDVVKNVFQNFDYQKYNVNYDRFMEWYEDKDTIILDLRRRDIYERSHIKGAIHFGADIDEKKLAEIVPNKETRIIVYCSNSLMATRMISLTHTSLPQFHALGYENTYMLDELWQKSNDFQIVDKLPMVQK